MAILVCWCCKTVGWEKILFFQGFAKMLWWSPQLLMHCFLVLSRDVLNFLVELKCVGSVWGCWGCTAVLSRTGELNPCRIETSWSKPPILTQTLKRYFFHLKDYGNHQFTISSSPASSKFPSFFILKTLMHPWRFTKKSIPVNSHQTERRTDFN